MPWIRLSDGTVAHVRLGKRGAKITQRDLEALEAAKRALDDLESVLLTCIECAQRYRGATVSALLYRSCLCGGELRA